MRFYLKLFLILSFAVMFYGMSGYCQNLSHIRAMAARPISDVRATEEMHAVEGQIGWEIIVAAPSTQPSTQPSPVVRVHKLTLDKK